MVAGRWMSPPGAAIDPSSDSVAEEKSLVTAPYAVDERAGVPVGSAEQRALHRACGRIRGTAVGLDVDRKLTDAVAVPQNEAPSRSGGRAAVAKRRRSGPSGRASRRSAAGEFGYGSARGSAPAHRRSDRGVPALRGDAAATDDEPGGGRGDRRVTLERLRSLAIDGLVLYDIDDESDRNPDERPFPFLPTMDPADYLARDLGGLEVPAIVYRAVGKYREDRSAPGWRSRIRPRRSRCSSGLLAREAGRTPRSPAPTSCATEVQPELPLGGVAIPERHARQGDEHLRLIAKQAAGCSFFVTQIVYDVNAAKNLISDYHHECAAQNLDPVPIVLSFSVCGSLKTLEFLRWLGVDRPALDRERAAPCRRHPRRLLRAGGRDGRRADRLLPPPRRSLRPQRRERLDPQGRDRGLRAARRPAGPSSAAERLQLTMPEEGLEPPTRGL